MSGCPEQHELRHAKNKAETDFISCPTWGASTVWFRTPVAFEFLNGNNGGRANYSSPRTRATPRIRKNPKKDSMDAFLADENEEEKAVCATCGAEVEEGIERCPNCHKELDWPEETKENPQEVEIKEESLLEKAARMTNEERARFIEERQREIDRKLEAMR